MSSQIILKAAGLNISPNPLSLPDGSLLVANDVIIKRDNVVESRRGYFEYSELLGNISKQLMEYKGRILVNYANHLAFDNGTTDVLGKAIFDDFNGTYNEVEPGLRMKSIEANKNLYFTTDAGIKKISASDPSQFSTSAGYVVDSGVVRAFDITGELDIEQGQNSGFLPSDSTVAYRVVWGYKDATQNLLLGAPSNPIFIYNYLSNCTALDLNRLCFILDTLNQSNSFVAYGKFALTFDVEEFPDANTVQTNILTMAYVLDYFMQFATSTGTQINTDTNYTLPGYTVLKTTTGENFISGIGRIAFDHTFSPSDPTLYFSVGDWINITGITNVEFSTTADPTKLNYNGQQKIINVVAPTGSADGYIEFQFNSTPNAVGPTALTGTITINSYNYENITNTGDTAFLYPDSLQSLGIPAQPSDADWQVIQNTISRIVQRLEIEKTTVIPSALITAYVSNYSITTSSNVQLKIGIPSGLSSNYFLQIYRTQIFQAVGSAFLGGSGVVANDEMNLVQEINLGSATGFLIFDDIYSQDLVANGAPLYTNAITGEGILNANLQPPLSTDINLYKNTVFYSNTKTRHTLNSFQLIGTVNIATGDRITVSDGTLIGSQSYIFTLAKKEITDITCIGAPPASSYFILYSANDNYIATGIDPLPNEKAVCFWYKVNGVGTAPTGVADLYVEIDLPGGVLSASYVAQRTIDAVNENIFDFIATPNTLPTLRVTNINAGIVTGFVDSGTGFTFSVFQAGDGEDPANFKIFLYQVQGTDLTYSLGSASLDIDAVSKSLIRVINFNVNSPINAYYASNSSTVPGLITLQNKELSDIPFYLETSTVASGNAFTPSIVPIHVESGAGIITGSGHIFTFTTSSPHGLVNGDQIMISGANVVVTPTGNIDAIYTVTVTDSTHFQVTNSIYTFVSNGSYFAWSLTSDVVISTNNATPNRIYYSKLNQPESVPLLNYFDIGAGDKNILRIFPLRNSLFVFKEDGVFRISGEIAPFVVELFDSSSILIAPDSVAVTNNIIYAWTRRGISCVNETGISEISRPIDTQILKLASSSYTNFSTVTWGVGYNSDNSYTVYTNASTNDTYATIAYRYCNLTNSWTNFIRSQTCGIIATFDDTQFMGDATTDLIQKERKNFDRTDYADKDFPILLEDLSSNPNGTILKFPSIVGIDVGDVITQTQYISVYNFNALLAKLDLDPTVSTSLISSVSSLGLVLTFTTAIPHNLSNGDYALIHALSGSGEILLNSTYQVSAITSTTFKITIPELLSAPIISGTVKYSYSVNLTGKTGDNLRTDLINLANRLDIDLATGGYEYFNHIKDNNGTITGNSIANPTIVTTSIASELVTGRIVTIAGSNSSLPPITGTFAIGGAPALPVATWSTATTFTIPINVSTTGGAGLTFDTSGNSQGFPDILACYNIIIQLLNDDPGVAFSDYEEITDSTLFEAVIIAVNQNTQQITLNIPEQWVVGTIEVYKAIPSLILYSPTSFNDQLSLKKIYEATMMFDNNAFTSATLSFSSDLYPQFTDILFYRDGNGIFGMYSPVGFGYGYFGGASNSAPFRTLIPRNNQYCRYLNVKFSHVVARELWALYGISVTGNIQLSSRAYR